MARVATNNISLQYAIEATQGVLPGTPTWKLLEPNTINTFGAEIETVTRQPISKNRQRKKGTTTDLTSAVEFEADLTLEHFQDFIEGFGFAVFNGPVHLTAGANFDSLSAVAAGPNFAHSAIGTALAEGTIVFSRGFTTSANNGEFEVDTGSTTTATPLKGSPSIVNETPTEASGASMSVAGVRSAAGDLDMSVAGSVYTITSTTLDFTTLSLTVGQMIHVGGTTNAIDGFLNAANIGHARIVSIAANALVVDKTTQVFITEANAAQTVVLLFGRFMRNVDVDDADYVERTFQFEGAFPDLGGVGTDEYEYAIGNFCNSLALTLPLTDKATFTAGFLGTDTEVPTPTRKTNAATPVLPNMTTALNTSADLARLRIQKVDETGITTCFKSLTLTLNNNVTEEKCLGTVGAANTSAGNFDVDVEAQLQFTDKAVPTAIRNNETVGLDLVLKNDDGGIGLDIPSMTLGGGDKEYPVNESVLINLTGAAFADPTTNTSIGASLFPVLPA